MFFILKVIISALVIAFVSWLVGKKPVLSGFLVALPLISILTIFFAHLEHGSMQKLNQFAVSIVVALPLTLAFFVPFLLNKWLKLNFAVSFASGLGLLVLAYFVHGWIFRA